MIDLTKIEHIYLYPGMTDMRLGIYGLRKKLLSIDTLNENSLYIFCGKSKNQIKIIEITSTSIWLYQNKLLKGKFLWPDKGDKSELTKEQLHMILEGMSLITSIEHKNEQFSLF